MEPTNEHHEHPLINVGALRQVVQAIDGKEHILGDLDGRITQKLQEELELDARLVDKRALEVEMEEHVNQLRTELQQLRAGLASTQRDVHEALETKHGQVTALTRELKGLEGTIFRKRMELGDVEEQLRVALSQMASVNQQAAKLGYGQLH
jgi:chromosome segregation ATPase